MESREQNSLRNILSVLERAKEVAIGQLLHIVPGRFLFFIRISQERKVEPESGRVGYLSQIGTYLFRFQS